MRILLVKSFAHPTSVGELAKGLKKLGHEVHLLLPYGPPGCNDLRNAAIPVHTMDIAPPRRGPVGKVGQNLRIAARLSRFVRTRSFEVIHLNLAHARLCGRLASLSLPQVRVVSTIRGFEAR